MKIIVSFLLAFFGIFFSYSGQACDSDMGHWRGDRPGMGHGGDYYGCRHMAPKLEKKFQKMPGSELFQTKGCTACHTIGGGDKTGPDLSGLF